VTRIDMIWNRNESWAAIREIEEEYLAWH
jgi:hypothetical protein